MATHYNLIVKAYEFAMSKHKDQMYGDMHYIYHIDNVYDIINEQHSELPELATLLVVGCLHDVVEDCGVTPQEISDSFGEDVAAAVVAISKVKGEGYDDYMRRVLSNDIATKVKIADTLTNLIHSFLGGNQKGMDKYPKQLMILRSGNVKG